MRKPQKAPPIAPARAVLNICLVFGPLLPCGQVTTAASTNLISCCCCSRCRIRSAWSAPSALLNSNTDRVVITYTPSLNDYWPKPISKNAILVPFRTSYFDAAQDFFSVGLILAFPFNNRKTRKHFAITHSDRFREMRTMNFKKIKKFTFALILALGVTGAPGLSSLTTVQAQDQPRSQ